MSNALSEDENHHRSSTSRIFYMLRKWYTGIRKILFSLLLNKNALLTSVLFHMYVLFAFIGAFSHFYDQHVTLNPFREVKWSHYLFYTVPRGTVASLFAAFVALYHGTRVEEQYGSSFFLLFTLIQFFLTNGVVIGACYSGIFHHVQTLTIKHRLFSILGPEYMVAALFLFNNITNSIYHLHIFAIPRAIHLVIVITLVLGLYTALYLAIPLTIMITMLLTICLMPVYTSHEFVKIAEYLFEIPLTYLLTSNRVKRALKRHNLPLSPHLARMVPTDHGEIFGHLHTSKGCAARSSLAIYTRSVTTTPGFHILKPQSSFMARFSSSRSRRFYQSDSDGDDYDATAAGGGGGDDDDNDDDSRGIHNSTVDINHLELSTETPNESTKLTSSIPISSSSPPLSLLTSPTSILGGIPLSSSTGEVSTTLDDVPTSGGHPPPNDSISTLSNTSTSSSTTTMSESSGDDDTSEGRRLLLSPPSHHSSPNQRQYTNSYARSRLSYLLSPLYSIPIHIFQPLTVSFIDCTHPQIVPNPPIDLDDILLEETSYDSHQNPQHIPSTNVIYPTPHKDYANHPNHVHITTNP